MVTKVARKPIRVGQVNAYIARLLAADGVLSDVSVVGEISNFKVHGSGHVYFSLKDEGSKIDCFLPAGVYKGLGFEPVEGGEVIAEGYVSVYEAGGRYSLTIRGLSASGRGDMALAYEELKKKLSEKGYFAEERKRTLPGFPRAIAIVTSATGAAVSDMQRTITLRNSAADILIFPTLVQGAGAADMIASRIRQVNAGYPDVDVMIVGRGGGSAEDLAAFNEETVADAIFESRVPVISAVGHETDFTIADFVADARAATPTAAAVMAAPDTGELMEDVDALMWQARSGLGNLLSRMELRVRANNMDALLSRLKSGHLERRTHASALMGRIGGEARAKADRGAELVGLRTAMFSAIMHKMERSEYRAGAQAEKLWALDPLAVLRRGYAIVEDEDGRAVSRASALTEGQSVRARFFDGSATAVVGEVQAEV